MTDSTDSRPIASHVAAAFPRLRRPLRAAPGYLRRLALDYVWLAAKNLLGWLLILFSVAFGVSVPGPGGLPIFLVGFALITFPGKRRLTARVLSGQPIRPDSWAFRLAVPIIAVLAPLGFVWYVWDKQLAPGVLHAATKTRVRIEVCLAVYVLSVVGLWAALWLGRDVLNLGLAGVKRARRKIRPWLAKRGIRLLPRRRRWRPVAGGGPDVRTPDPEILAVDDAYYRAMATGWRRAKPWLFRIAGVVITLGIFYYMLRPIRAHWPDVREQIATINGWRFAAAAVMFAAFLFFRALSWRRVLIGLGHTIPIRAAVRIWSNSELTRYLPGSIAQFVGRAYLVRPYGVSGSLSSTSQILELATFLLANLLLAAACLAWYGFKVANPDAKPWLITALVLVPVIGFVLHPKFFYAAVNKVMAKIGRPAIAVRLDGWALTRLLGRYVLALLWQSAAVFILLAPVLHLKWEWAWTVAGAYSVAWSMGLIAVWAAAGMGVREVVFVAVLQSYLSTKAAAMHWPAAPGQVQAELYFLAILLRLWTIAGELLLAVVANSLDCRGAFGRPAAKPAPVAAVTASPAALPLSPAAAAGRA